MTPPQSFSATTSVATPTIPTENSPFAFQVIRPTPVVPTPPNQPVVILKSEASSKDQKYEKLETTTLVEASSMQNAMVQKSCRRVTSWDELIEQFMTLPINGGYGKDRASKSCAKTDRVGLLMRIRIADEGYA